MLRGIYMAGSGMVAEQAWLDALAGDVANVNTPGYRRTADSFDSYLEPQLQRNVNGLFQAALGPVSYGSAFLTYGGVDRMGPMTPTGRPLDLALAQQGWWFAVRRDDGSTGYVRTLALRPDSTGLLVNPDGLPVLSVTGQPLRLPPGTGEDQVRVDSGGRLLAGGQTVGQLAVVRLDGPIVPAPDGTYAGSPAPAGLGAPAGLVVSGVLEGSNVALSSAMVDLIRAQRAYQLSASALRTEDQELGRLYGLASTVT
ncbi:MAG: flagellar hook-basal body protein [Bacillota bacterium]|nr:flagellar hook-basal body protein [Bacillota bacterium]